MIAELLKRRSIIGQCGIALALSGLGLCLPVPLSAAPSGVPSAPIMGISGGWNDNIMRVRLEGPFINPQGCPLSDGYVTDPGQTGASLFNSMLMSAYMANKPVALTIDGCLVDRPRIIAVTIGTV